MSTKQKPKYLKENKKRKMPDNSPMGPYEYGFEPRLKNTPIEVPAFNRNHSSSTTQIAPMGAIHKTLPTPPKKPSLFSYGAGKKFLDFAKTDGLHTVVDIFKSNPKRTFEFVRTKIFGKLFG